MIGRAKHERMEQSLSGLHSDLEKSKLVEAMHISNRECFRCMCFHFVYCYIVSFPFVILPAYIFEAPTFVVPLHRLLRAYWVLY